MHVDSFFILQGSDNFPISEFFLVTSMYLPTPPIEQNATQSQF